MKTRTDILFSNGKVFQSKESDVTEEELDEIKEFYKDCAGDWQYLVLTDSDGTWYCFPGAILNDAILCIVVTEK